MPYAPTASSEISNGNIQPTSDRPCRTFDFITSKTWKHCQNKKSPTKTKPSLKFKLPFLPSAQTAPVKNKIAVSVSRSDRRLSSCAFPATTFFFFGEFLFFDGRTLIPQKIAGRPSTSVTLVTLLTSELVITSAPLPPFWPRMKAKIKLP